MFNPLASSNRNTAIPALFKANERAKRRSYEQRIMEVEHGSFTPLVFAATGGMGPAATTFYKRLASMIAKKHNQDYARIINWMRCRLRFSLLRSSIVAIRGSRSTSAGNNSIDIGSIPVIMAEGNVPIAVK